MYNCMKYRRREETVLHVHRANAGRRTGRRHKRTTRTLKYLPPKSALKGAYLGLGRYHSFSALYHHKTAKHRLQAPLRPSTSAAPQQMTIERNGAVFHKRPETAGQASRTAWTVDALAMPQSRLHLYPSSNITGIRARGQCLNITCAQHRECVDAGPDWICSVPVPSSNSRAAGALKRAKTSVRPHRRHGGRVCSVPRDAQ